MGEFHIPEANKDDQLGQSLDLAMIPSLPILDRSQKHINAPKFPILSILLTFDGVVPRIKDIQALSLKPGSYVQRS